MNQIYSAAIYFYFLPFMTTFWRYRNMTTIYTTTTTSSSTSSNSSSSSSSSLLLDVEVGNSSINLSLFRPLAALVPLLSPFLDDPSSYSLKNTNRSFRLHHLISAIIFPSHFVSLLISLLHIHHMPVHVHHHHLYPP